MEPTLREVSKDQLHQYARAHLKQIYGKISDAKTKDKFHANLGLLYDFIECGFEAGFRTDNKPN